MCLLGLVLVIEYPAKRLENKGPWPLLPWIPGFPGYHEYLGFYSRFLDI